MNCCLRSPTESVKQTVAEIKKNEKVDMIACVSHGGTWEDEDKSEDEILAKKVPELDLIISGHSHTELKEADSDMGIPILCPVVSTDEIWDRFP